MAAIYLIRHGQASFGAADYDQLSDKGYEQARMLGACWKNFSTENKLYSGDLLRHIQTFENFQKGVKHKDMSITINSGFNEFDHVDILKNYNDQWSDFSKMSEHFARQSQANKKLQKEFSLALAKWVACNEKGQYKELWSEFKQRCITALNEVINQHLESKQQDDSTKGKDIFIFTSGGTISILIQHILKLTDQQTLEINQQLRNTCVTKLLFSKNNLSVDYFNNYSHLTKVSDDWVTFR